MAAGALGHAVKWDLEFRKAQVEGEVQYIRENVEPFNFGDVGISTAFLLVAVCLRMWLFKLGGSFCLNSRK